MQPRPPLVSALPPPRLLALLAGYLLAGLLGLGLSAYAFQRSDDRPIARAFGYLALVAPLICLGLAARVLVTSLDAKLALNVVAYVGWVAIGPLVLVFALRFVGAREWLSRPMLVALGVVPALTLLLVATTPLHSLHYAEVGVRYVDGWPLARLQPGQWFWIHAAYEYGLILFGIGILARYATVAADPFRTQAATLVAALLFMTGTNVAFLVFDIAPFPGGDLTPLGIVVGLTAIGIAVFRVQFIDVVPVARDRVFEALDDAVVVIDPAGRVVDANEAGERLLDGSEPVPAAAEALPRPVVEAGLLEEGAEPTEVTITVGNGDRWFLTRQQPVGDEAIALILTDVTAQREREERLEEFAAVLSHDLRNPLAVASGNIQLAREVDDPTEQLRTAERAIERTNHIIDDLLTLAREGGAVTDPETGDLRAVAEAAWETVDTADATLTVAETTMVEAEFGRLQRAFENLFRNAVEHVGPDVCVTVGPTDDGFYVEDDGPGIPESDREQVFDRGYTTGGSGAGIGLSVVASTAEAHGWSVAATESESGGARFEFETGQRSVSDHEQS